MDIEEMGLSVGDGTGPTDTGSRYQDTTTETG